jgi:DNA-directed RNA polymerase specialized sigma24 family protein
VAPGLRILKNVYKSEVRRMPSSVSIDQVPEPSEAPTAESALERDDRRRLMRRALHSLPAKYRDVLILF